MPHLTQVELTPRQSLGVAGERPHLTYFPVDCLLSMVSTEGVEALNVGREGSSFSDLALKAAILPLDVVVSIGGRAWSMQTARLQAMADADVAIRRGLAEAHHAAFCEAALVSVGRAKGSRMGDLARWLFRGCEVTGTMSLAISHAHLSSLLGTRRQTITTKLAEMEGMNLIATRRTLITVRDLAGLARISDKPTC
jgi:hypothetical protein